MLRSTSTAIGGSGIERVAGRLERLLGRDRPSIVTTGPDSWKIEVVSTASSSRPPPLPRRSNTIPSAPSAQQRVDLVAQLAVGAAAEGGELHVADLAAVGVSILRLDGGDLHLRPLDVELAPLARLRRRPR